MLSPTDVEHATDVMSGAKVLICQLEVPMETTLVALQMGRQYKGECSLLSPWQPCIFAVEG